MSASEFYDRMSSYYHLIYADWDASIKRQASQLNDIISRYCGSGGHRVLDAACGIGTQSIGLAGLGYEVTASDLSPGSIARATEEAAARRIDITFSVADMTRCSEHHRSLFDVVIACDNAVPHLLTDELILQAFRQFFQCTLPGGCCIISVRDYSGTPRTDTHLQPYGIRTLGDKKIVIVQAQEFDGNYYNVSMYFIEDDGSAPCVTHTMRSRYYAVSTARLAELMNEAGFHDVERLDGAYFQPILIGKKMKEM